MEDNEVKASEETVTAEQQIAEEIDNDVKTPVEPQGEVQQETPTETLSPDKIASMTAKAAADAAEKALNSFQGKFANHTASQQKELQELIDQRLKPVIDWTEKVEQAQVEQLDPEQQVEYYKSKLKQKDVVAPEIQKEEGPTETQKMLAETTRQLIQDNNLDITEFDERIWKGWNANMTPGQLVALANKNITAIKTPPQPKQTAQQTEEAPAPTVPPTTSGAPKGIGSRVTTVTDLSQLMAEGKIDANQYRLAKNEIKTKGFYNL